MGEITSDLTRQTVRTQHGPPALWIVDPVSSCDNLPIGCSSDVESPSSIVYQQRLTTACTACLHPSVRLWLITNLQLCRPMRSSALSIPSRTSRLLKNGTAWCWAFKTTVNIRLMMQYSRSHMRCELQKCKRCQLSEVAADKSRIIFANRLLNIIK